MVLPTLETVSNIGMSTNLINPICAVGFVTLSRSMKGATGSPSIFSLSLCKKKRIVKHSKKSQHLKYKVYIRQTTPQYCRVNMIHNSCVSLSFAEVL